MYFDEQQHAEIEKDKTEFIVISSKQHVEKTESSHKGRIQLYKGFHVC